MGPQNQICKFRFSSNSNTNINTCFEFDTGYLGQPRGSNGVGRAYDIASAFECQVACHEDDLCEYWTWNSPQWFNRHETCWFKNSMDGRTEGQTGRVSGPANCDCFAHDATIGRGAGNGFPKVEDVFSAFECQQICFFTEGCENFIWNSSEHANNPNVCWPKRSENYEAGQNSVGTARDMNRISGPKVCDGSSFPNPPA